MIKGYSYKKLTLFLIIVSTIIRLFLSASIEFGNDEVYYWLYAKYPALSHFDHPSMVGFFIQLTTFNLAFDSELFIRLASVLSASGSMWILYLITVFIKNDKAGFIAVLLYNLSIYGLIISGTFILPDAPLVLFSILSFYYFVQSLPEAPKRHTIKKLLIAFLFTGCAIYSKYQAVYLLLGTGIYVLLFSRHWLQKWQFYVGFIFPLLAIGTIIYWNYQNDFISYKFHGNRVSLVSLHWNGISFGRELLGQFLYNNPYVFIITLLVIYTVIKGQFSLDKRISKLFLSFSIPLIITVIYLSISRDTLPHWSGISYILLLPLAAIYSLKWGNIHIKRLVYGVIGIYLLAILAVFVVNKGWFLQVVTIDNIAPQKVNRSNPLMDMYGWRQAEKKVIKVLKDRDLHHLPIVANKWYPAAHLHYYIARPNNLTVYALGDLHNIHKYYWIHKKQPPLRSIKKAIYITDSRNYKHPKELNQKYFSDFKEVEVIPIYQGKQVVKYLFVFILT